MATGLELTEGDVVVITVDGVAYANYKACGFTGTVKVTGSHDFYVAEDGIWVNQPKVENPDASTITVYYYNANNWKSVNAYAWIGVGSNAVWPGETMTAVDGKDGWYSIKLSAEYTNIIFNDGKNQTKDLVLDTTKSEVYYNNGWVDAM